MASASGQVVEVGEPGRNKPNRVCRWETAILVQPGSSISKNLASQPDAALSLRFQKARALGLWIQAYRDHIVTAHRHVAMILPAQSLDRCEVAAAVCINPFGSVDFAEIAGPNRFRGRKFALDQGRRSRLTEPSESSRNLFFSCIVTRHNCRRCLDTGRQIGGFSRQKTKTVISYG